MALMIKNYKSVKQKRILNIDFSHKELFLISILKCIFFFVFPIVIICLPENYFDQGQSLCISQLLFHQECLACGLTRGCLYLIHLNFEEAFRFNMMSFVALPAISILWVKWTFEEYKRIKVIHSLIKSKE